MPTKAKLTIRCAIGAYLLYTDYMISGVFAEEMTTDAIFRIIAFIVFAIAGVGLIVWSARDFFKGNYLDGGLREREEQEKN